MEQNEGLSVISSQHDHLLSELESNEDHLGPTLRSVYETGQQEDFMARLDGRIKGHERDIERMCNHHYQGFIDSVNELLKVRADARNLKVKIQEAQFDLERSGKQLTQKGDELISLRTIQRNLAQTTEALMSCLPVLDQYSKLREQMKNKRYYPALKSLEQLEHTLLPRVSQYSFAKLMHTRIPQLRESIKAASRAELTDFLEIARDKAELIGKLAMEQTRQRSNIRLPKEFHLENFTTEDLDKSAQDIVDFSPVYRCLHIYTVLGERESFSEYYRQQRKEQARLVLERSGNADYTIKAYQSYFYQIAGFFVIEDQVLHTTEGLVLRSFLDDRWEFAYSKISAVLDLHQVHSQEAILLRHVKELIVWFNRCMQDYGFNVAQMYDLLLKIRDLYNEMLMRSWAYIFTDIFKTDDYTPMTVQSQEEYDAHLKKFPHQDVVLHKSPFPRSFPYSGFVPRVFLQVKEFIDESASYAENLNLSQTDIDGMIRKSVNLLLTKILNGRLSAMINQSTLRLPQLIQVILNMTHLEKACPHWEQYISTKTGTNLDQLHAARLYGASIFKDARRDAESALMGQLRGQLNELFDLADYRWTPSAMSSRPSSYIIDMMTFLKSTFQSIFPALPEHAACTCCMDACKYIGKRLVQFLESSEEGTKINMNGIKSFSLDVTVCENFASSQPTPSLKPEMLAPAFEEVRQLVDLFVSMDWSAYVAEYRSHSRPKYQRVRPQTVAAVLEKFKDSDQKKGFFPFKKGERDRRRLLETIIRRLHELAGTPREKLE
ncbi:exocyst complex component 6B-like isoform X2 [Oscarella lobularis]|uniref:exocyst complex component 6B-like isoform X2 n=1 Tax=Oscarella lobularis TaxID=121494 RepID=UPI003313352F